MIQDLFIKFNKLYFYKIYINNASKNVKIYIKDILYFVFSVKI